MAKKKQVLKQKKKSVKKAVVKRKSKKVAPIPKNYHSITPYLTVSDGAKAIDFYKKAFNAKVNFVMEMPGGRVTHAELKIGDSIIMIGENCPEKGAFPPDHFKGSPVGIHLYVKEVDVVVKRAVKAGAKLIRPIENMFYGDRCGGITDPSGHTWCVATHIENVTPAQAKKRAMELYSKK